MFLRRYNRIIKWADEKKLSMTSSDLLSKMNVMSTISQPDDLKGSQMMSCFALCL